MRSPPAADIGSIHPRWAAAWEVLKQRVGETRLNALNTDLRPGLSGLQLALAGAMILLTAALIFLLRQLARRQVAQLAPKAASNPAAPSFLTLTLEEARPPVFLFAWLAGIYGAVWVLIFRLPAAAAYLAILHWLARAAAICGTFWFLYRMVTVVERQLAHWTRRSLSKWDNVIAVVLVRALRLLTPFAAVFLLLPTLPLPAGDHGIVQEIASLVLIGGLGFSACDLAAAFEQAVSTNYSTEGADNLARRKIQTQVGMLRKIAVTLIGMITIACMLMVFPSVRHVGTSMLASAGLAGVVLGFAAQKSLGNLIAGIQIAFTQPIRIDDVVVVEGEWGHVEEISLTYVVIRIWDLRRLIVPITYFIEKPIANWTRTGSNILQTVFLYLDYTAPLDALRSELDRILAQSPYWDRQAKGLQVTDTTATAMQVRVLVSAADSGQAFNLCCEVREKLISFLQQNHPGALPRTRAEVNRRTEFFSSHDPDIASMDEGTPTP